MADLGKAHLTVCLQLDPRSRDALIAMGWTPPPDQDPAGGAAAVPE